jgi:hypothetical protein
MNPIQDKIRGLRMGNKAILKGNEMSIRGLDGYFEEN